MNSLNNNNNIYIFKTVFTNLIKVLVKRNFIKPNNHVADNFIILCGSFLNISKLFCYEINDRSEYLKTTADKIFDLGSEHKFEEGLVLCNKLIEMETDNPRVYWVRGTFYEYFKQYGKAIKDYEKLLELTSKNSSRIEISLRKLAYENLALIQAIRGDKDYAIDILLEAEKNKNTSPKSLFILSDLYNKKENYGLGFKYAKLAYDLLDENPKDLDDLYTRYQYAEKILDSVYNFIINSEYHQDNLESIKKLLTSEGSIEVTPLADFKLSEAFEYIITYSLKLIKRINNLIQSKQIENEDLLIHIHIVNSLFGSLLIVAAEGVDILNSDLYDPSQFKDESKNPFRNVKVFLELLNTIITDLFTSNKE